MEELGLKLDLTKVGRIWILRAENEEDTLLMCGKNSEKKGKSCSGRRFREKISSSRFWGIGEDRRMGEVNQWGEGTRGALTHPTPLTFLLLRLPGTCPTIQKLKKIRNQFK